MKTLTTAAVLALLAATTAHAQAQTQDAAPAISAERMNEAVRVLASDEFEGRGPVSAGEEKTVAWLAEQFRAAANPVEKQAWRR